MPNSIWFLVSNFNIPIAEDSGHKLTFESVQLYTSIKLSELAEGETLSIDPEIMTIQNYSPDRETKRFSKTNVIVGKTGVYCCTSSLNTVPLYFYIDRLNGYFAVFNDIFLSPWVLKAVELPVVIRINEDRWNTDESPIHYIYRMGFNTKITFTQSENNISVNTVCHPDDLPHPKHFQKMETDPVVAGEVVLKALAHSVKAATNSVARAAVLLSGGIDSGSIAYFGAQSGIALEAYSVGTPWGNEFSEAKETADFLNIPISFLNFSTEQIMNAIPDTIRWLGTYEPETIDIALTSICFQKYTNGPTHVLTGYGNDLLNAGIYKPFSSYENLGQQVFYSVTRTRWSNELSPLASIAYGRRFLHPYWSSEVVQKSLSVSPTCKVLNNREKYYFRLAMEKHLPKAIAWRQKIAVHHGTGLEAGLNSHLDTIARRHNSKLVWYHEIFTALLNQAKKGDLKSPTHMVYENISVGS